MSNPYEVLRSLGPIEKNITESLLNLLPGTVFVVDKYGYLMWGNQRILDILELKSLDEYIGKNIGYWENTSWVQCETVLKTGKETTQEETYKDRYYLTTRKPLFSEGEVVAVLGASLDITASKQAEIAKKQFLENMEHDLRTPFSGIHSMAALLDKQITDPFHKECLAVLMFSTTEWMKAVDAILNITRQTGQPFKNTHFDITDLILELKTLIQAAVQSKGLKLSVTCPSYVINTDRLRLYHILLNLLGNAVKFTLEGSITLTVTINTYLNIEISDTGIGISENNLTSIFEKFTKVTPSNRTGDFVGVGVGLYNAQTYANDLGGSITVKSKLGKGSTFLLKLPL